jgi:hypothetical protein
MKLRTYKEIITKIDNEVVSNDMCGWNLPDYVEFLPYEYAKKYLKDEVTKEEWEKDRREYTLENVLLAMKDYLPFAFEKAKGERGISANRSMDHYKNWFWLLGEDDMSDHVWDAYHDYGMPKLEEIETWLEEIERRPKEE